MRGKGGLRRGMKQVINTSNNSKPLAAGMSESQPLGRMIQEYEKEEHLAVMAPGEGDNIPMLS